MRENKSVNTSVWERRYGNRERILKYPDTPLVTIAHYLLRPDQQPRILDYGFGSGANMLYFLKRGFNCSGAEVSESAIRITSDVIEKEGFKADLMLIKDGKMLFLDNTFDAVIAWNSLYYNNWEGLANDISEIDRVLKPGGLFLGTMRDPGGIKGRGLGDNLYELAETGQEGAIIIAVDKSQLKRCFPNKEIVIGKTGFNFGDIGNPLHWIISYKK